MNKEQTKRILGFLLLKPAISSRNLTSLGLVAIFFGVYVAAGGKIQGLPVIEDGSGFGAIEKTEQAAPATAAERTHLETPPPAGLDTSRLQFGKKNESGQPAANSENTAHPAQGSLDSLSDRLNKVGTARRPQ